ncbi:MAG TPA: isoprenylcysteine carboxylmethyltransferase family protein [Candidatus Aminicenantes bacterium]|nr:isoprenylcysteine carboxylmethyltransferase family protein [Candidatus Aminicenantes bacterium]
MKRTKLKNTIYRWRVRIGSLAAAAAVILARPSFRSVIIGFIISTIGLLLRTWACGHIQKETKLSMSGPYRYTRNPLYFGNLIIGTGVTTGAHSWWVFGIFCLYFFIFYPVIIGFEKQKMERLFPSQYQTFKKVPLFIPALRPRISYKKEAFKWSLYLANKEYRAFVGVMIFWAALIIKTIIT